MATAGGKEGGDGRVCGRLGGRKAAWSMLMAIDGTLSDASLAAARPSHDVPFSGILFWKMHPGQAASKRRTESNGVPSQIDAYWVGGGVST